VATCVKRIPLPGGSSERMTSGLRWLQLHQADLIPQSWQLKADTTVCTGATIATKTRTNIERCLWKKRLCEIWDVDVVLLGCDAVWTAFSPEDGDSMFLRNVAIYLRVYTASLLRTPSSLRSCTPQWSRCSFQAETQCCKPNHTTQCCKPNHTTQTTLQSQNLSFLEFH
jgi:hypothetical protein